jgi:hypothetical protein
MKRRTNSIITYILTGLFISLLCGFTLLGQEIDEKNQIEELIRAFPKEKVIVTHSNVTYSIDKNRSGVPVSVTERAEDRFIALQPRVHAVEIRFYDMFSRIDKHKVDGTGKFNTWSSQRCGDYEIDGIFYHDAKICEFYLQFEEPGDFLTVSTTKTYSDLKYLTRIPLHKLTAVFEKTVRIEIPKEIDLELVEMNLEGFEVERSEHKNEVSGNKIIEYKILNVPSSLELENLPGYSCTYPHLVALFKAYEKDGERISLIENTDDLYRWYKSLVSENELSQEIAELTEQLAASKKSDTAKIAAVYYWIQDKIRYIAFEDGYAAFIPEDPNNVYRYKYADCKGMANLTKTMLKHLGYDARLCWVYTGNNCYPRNIPSLASDNHMICAVKLYNDFIFLDATVNYSTFSEIPEGIQGKECIIEDGSNYIIASIPSTEISENLVKIENNIRIDQNKLMIDGSIRLTGTIKKLFQYYLNHVRSDLKEDLLDYFITMTDNNFNIINLITTPADSMTREFSLDYDAEVSNVVLDLGDEMLLSLDLYNEYRDQKIDSTRPYPYLLESREIYAHEVKLKLPSNLIISRLPDTLSYKHPVFEFTGSYGMEDTLLVYRKKLRINEDILQVDHFKSWNEGINALNKFYNQMVILKKL